MDTSFAFRVHTNLRSRLPDRDSWQPIEVVVVRGEMGNAVTMHEGDDCGVVGEQAVCLCNLRSITERIHISIQNLKRNARQASNRERPFRELLNQLGMLFEVANDAGATDSGGLRSFRHHCLVNDVCQNLQVGCDWNESIDGPVEKLYACRRSVKRWDQRVVKNRGVNEALGTIGHIKRHCLRFLDAEFRI